jgi:hypothetical protein
VNNRGIVVRISAGARDFFIFQSIPLWFTQNHIQQISALFSSGGKRRLGYEANDLPSLGPKLRKGGAVPYIPALVFMAVTGTTFYISRVTQEVLK